MQTFRDFAIYLRYFCIYGLALLYFLAGMFRDTGQQLELVNHVIVMLLGVLIASELWALSDRIKKLEQPKSEQK
jgi:hypothetical protein